MDDSVSVGADAGVALRAGRAAGEPFSELLRRVRAAGLLEHRHRYYTAKMVSNLLLLAGAWAAFVAVGDSWWQLVVAVALAFCYTQTGFIGHDIGHRQVTQNRRLRELLGTSHGN